MVVKSTPDIRARKKSKWPMYVVLKGGSSGTCKMIQKPKEKMDGNRINLFIII